MEDDNNECKVILQVISSCFLDDNILDDEDNEEDWLWRARYVLFIFKYTILSLLINFLLKIQYCVEVNQFRSKVFFIEFNFGSVLNNYALFFDQLNCHWSDLFNKTSTKALRRHKTRAKWSSEMIINSINSSPLAILRTTNGCLLISL